MGIFRMAGRWENFWYAGGALPSALLYQSFATYTVFFYIDVLRVPSLAVGAIMGTFGLWNAANDLLVGYWSDRTRTRWGRRRPYMFLGALPLALTYALLWAPPRGLHGEELLPWLLGTVFLFDFCYTAVVLNWAALFPEVAVQPEERAQLAGVRQSFRIVGTIAAASAPPLLAAAIGWSGMGALFAGIAAAFFLLSAWGARERSAFAVGSPLPLLPALRHALLNKPFALVLLAHVAINFAFVTLSSAFPFYTKYVLGGGEAANSGLLALVFVTAFVALRGWGRLAVRWEPRKTALVAATAFAMALSPFALARNVLEGAGTAFLVGLTLAGLMIVLDLLLPEVIDADEVRTGLRREGVYYGVNGVIIRLSISLQAVAFTLVFARTGFDPALAVQPLAALEGLRLLVSGLPALGMLIAGGALIFYPIHGRVRDHMREQLAEIRSQRQACLNPGDGPEG
jgi:GPH family glycoside/pentoside/hexuronide:cation symporter